METYPLNKEAAMPDVLAWDLPIRPIKPGDGLPSDQAAPGPLPPRAGFLGELNKIFAGLLGR